MDELLGKLSYFQVQQLASYFGWSSEDYFDECYQIDDDWFHPCELTASEHASEYLQDKVSIEECASAIAALAKGEL